MGRKSKKGRSRKSGRSRKRRRGRKRKYMDITSASVTKDYVVVRRADGTKVRYKLRPRGHYVKVRKSK